MTYMLIFVIGICLIWINHVENGLEKAYGKLEELEREIEKLRGGR